MKFLTKLGGILLKGTQIALGLAPIIGAAVPGAGGTVGLIVSDLQKLTNIVVEVEAIGQALSLTGVQKLAAAGPLIKQAILNHPMLVGKKVKDWAAFNVGCDQMTSGLVAIWNSIDPGTDVPTENKSA